ncbi:MAG: ATP-dependent helicase [Patescibacteria group bacterium]|nr:ATP-dependent helicase [Patescibacteria group bacterium]
MNQKQKQAVEYHQGPLLVIAGAGTGKTFVITEKIKHLIKNQLAKPEEILALTFTEKAALEMEERVDKTLPLGFFQMWISTFHSFAHQILKEEAIHIGLPSNFRLMTEAEAILFLRQNLFLFDLDYFRPLGNPHKFLNDLLQHFSRLRDEDISPQQYILWVKTLKSEKETKEEKQKYLELAFAYEKYQKLKIKEGLMDFADLVFYLLQLFRQRPTILKKYQQQFSYLLVDEFQDTNIAQYELIKLLSPAKNNPRLTVVGDDSQSIYKFRGASISNILSFMKDYPQAKQINLNINYRSNQTILNAAYQLIKNNDPDTLEAKLAISKKLIAKKKNNKKAVSFFLAKTVEQEAEFVANKILALKSFYKFSDFAILVRANNHVTPFIQTLSQKGIPYQFFGPGMLFKQPEVKDLIAYLKVLVNPEDSPSLFRVLSMEIFSLDKKDLSLLLSFSKKINQPLFQTLEIYLSFFDKTFYQEDFSIYQPHLPLIKNESRKKLLSFFKMINRHLSLIKKETAGQILYYFLEDTHYLHQLVNYKTEKEEKIALNISKFFNKLKTYEQEHEDASVFAVVDYLEMSLELGESPLVSQTDIPEYDAVNLLTVHSAKGLEFPVVFLVNLTTGRFPTYQKKEAIPLPKELIKEILPQGNYHLQEERRLFYVGLTRTKDFCFLSSSLFYGEGKRERRISPFVFETLKKTLEKTLINNNDKKNNQKKLSFFDFKKTDEKIIKKKLIFNEFSFSQLEIFNTCPLQYKYQYVLKIPTLPQGQLSFGETIHKTLYLFYKEFLKNKKINLNDLLEIYQKNWVPVGYSSLAHQKRMKKEGEKILINFFKNHHQENLKIIALEKFFKINLDQGIIISGKIDRVDQKNKGKIEIIDYKTGKQPSEKELKKDLQLSLYALAATDKKLFNKKPSQIELSFYFLQTNNKVTFKKNEEDIKNLKKEIIETVEKIRQEKFIANPGRWCDFCPFRIICEAWQ